MSMAWPCASVVPQFNDFDVGLVENRPKLYLDFILPVLRLCKQKRASGRNTYIYIYMF